MSKYTRKETAAIAEKEKPYGNLTPAAHMPMNHDVMCGPENTFTAQDPANNTPKALLYRPGNLRLGTKMG
jgi:hypothetical protein